MDLRSRLRHPGRCGEPAAPSQPAGPPLVRRAERALRPRHPAGRLRRGGGYLRRNAGGRRGDPAALAEVGGRARGARAGRGGGAGRIGPHWRRFGDGSAALGPEGRAAAGESTRQLLRESGIAFNVYADPDDRQHAWRLDLVPVFLLEQEWDVLAAGILQRARLIDAVLADLHGGQTLVRDGSLPASLLLGSPAFVRTSVERDGPPRRFLYAYACDV